MTSVKESTSGSSTSVSLVVGDDEYELQTTCSAVIQKWTKELPDAEPEVIDAQVGNLKDMGESVSRAGMALESLSLFGSGKIVWLRSCNYVGSEGRVAQSAETTKRLDELLEKLKLCDWLTTRFLISCTAIDKRKRFYKWLKASGKVYSCESLASQGDRAMVVALRLIQDQVANRNKTIRPEIAERLVHSVGLNRRALVSECEKAILHCGDGNEVSGEDVEAVVTKSRQAKAFAFADAVAERRLEGALRCLDDELWEMRTDRQKSEMGLLYSLITKFRVLLMIKDLVSRKRVRPERNYSRFRTQIDALDKSEFPEDRRLNPLKQNPYVLFRALGQVDRYSQMELVRSLANLMRCNLKMISVGDDPGTVLRECVIDIVLGRSSA